ncbi:Uncharacterised protein [Streptococcus suis]|nr:Uncharacterised protein [Streptococcus suis]
MNLSKLKNKKIMSGIVVLILLLIVMFTRVKYLMLAVVPILESMITLSILFIGLYIMIYGNYLFVKYSSQRLRKTIKSWIDKGEK